jgi:hypothetical protein
MLAVLLSWLADEARSTAVCGAQGAGRWWAPQAAQAAVAVVIEVVRITSSSCLLNAVGIIIQHVTVGMFAGGTLHCS